MEEVLIAASHDSIANVPPAHVYGFRAAPFAADLLAWQARGAAMVANVIPGRIRPDAGGAGGGAGVAALAGALGRAPAAAGALVVGGAPPGAAPAAALLVNVTDNTTPGALQWVLAETMGAEGYGTVVNCALPLVKDQRVIYQCACMATSS